MDAPAGAAARERLRAAPLAGAGDACLSAARVRPCSPAAASLPTAAALSDAVKAANADVEAALRQERLQERQRDCQGIVSMFQARPSRVRVQRVLQRRSRLTHTHARTLPVRVRAPQGVSARLFALSVAMLLLLAFVFSGACVCRVVSRREPQRRSQPPPC